MRKLLLLATLLGCLWPVSAAAQTTVELPCRSVMLAEAHKINNYGYGQYWIKVGNGRNRMLISCDLSALRGREADVLSATYRIYIATENFVLEGTELSLHREDGTRAAWVEGKGIFDTLKYCQDPDFYVPSTNLGGPGATWNCPVDPDTRKSIQTPHCALEDGWMGGFPGHEAEPSATIRAMPGAPNCGISLSCEGNGGQGECWQSLEWPVTADVVSALADPIAPQARWLLKRTVETGQGGFYAFPEEHAVCKMGRPFLRPALVVTLNGEAPVVEDPLDEVVCTEFLGG